MRVLHECMFTWENYVKIKKTIYQKKRKDSLRTLFVEIPSYKGAVDRAASLESALPNLT